jgi:dTDP-4-dehydrorhamnose reductase
VRIFLTGASGFVGSNLAHVFAERHGAEVLAPGHEHVDLTDALMVSRAVAATRADAIVHAAIWNDPAAMLTDRRRAWDTYVGATRSLVDAANRVGAQRGTIARLRAELEQSWSPAIEEVRA